MHNRTCKNCGKKHSVAKGKEVCLEVHHSEGIDWDGIVDLIIERVLQTPDKYEVLCKECHSSVHSSSESSTSS